jgi:dolichyl-phosphate beta-glucosyltransferase
VPAYNEERRLPPALIDMIDFLDGLKIQYEILVVDDGSHDQTEAVVRKFTRIREQVRLIRLPRNYGKGHAVRTGMLNASGQYLLFADADGATPIEELERLLNVLKNENVEVAIGSRAMGSEETAISTVWYRKAMGRIFNFFVNSFLLPDFHDTQCGFKMFSRRAGRFLFSHQQSDGFSFDIELLFLSKNADIKVREVPVNWTNVPGSKVNLILDSLRMFRDIFVFRLRHHGMTPQSYANFEQDEEKTSSFLNKTPSHEESAS